MTSETTPHSHKTKKSLALLFAFLVFALFIIFAFAQWLKRAANPLSETAVLNAPIVNISAGVPGKIKKIHVQDGALVEQGQLLFELESTFFELTLKKARADLALAQATLNTKKRIIQAEEHNFKIAQEQVQRAQVNLKLATQTYQRLQQLAPKGYVPKQQVDEARTLMNDAEISLNQALEQQAATQVLINNLEAEQAMVETASAAVQIAEYELSKTRVEAPFSGRIVGLNTRNGTQVMPGVSLFSLVDVGNTYAVAYFKETDLQGFHRGNCATVYILADSTRPAEGVVDEIGWGVTSTEQIDFPFQLPYVQKTLNWVHIAQRFPVHIKLKEAPVDLLRAGASASVVIHNREQCD